MGKRVVVQKNNESKPPLQISRKKIVEGPAHNYLKQEFLQDTAQSRTHQVTSDMRETKFNKGFFRKPHVVIQPERERVVSEKERESRRLAKLEQREQYFKTEYKSINPITGHNLDNNRLHHHKSIKVDKQKLVHEEQKPLVQKRNVQREELVRNDGLTIRKKDYSVAEFFKTYDSYGIK